MNTQPNPIDELKREIVNWMHKGIQDGKTIPVFEDMVDTLLAEKESRLASYMDFVDEMSVETPFEVAFETLNKKLQALTPTKHD